MADYTTKDFNVTPYRDDFVFYRNFLRILFKPAAAVQARELTQLQTAAQWQMQQLANHIFKDGSPVSGAEIKVTKNAPYIEVELQDITQVGTSTQISGNAAELVGQYIQGWDGSAGGTASNPSGPLAKVIAVDNIGGSPAKVRLQLDYVGGQFTTNNALISGHFMTVNYNDNDATDFPTKYQTSYLAATDNISGIGTGMRANVSEGVVWINGFFCAVLPQVAFITKTGTTGTFVVGYEYREVTLTANDTTELDPVTAVILGNEIKDNATGSNNDAPGADRYMVEVMLTSYTDGTQPSEFHQVMKITNGEVEQKLEKPAYSDILDLLAKRTYDESGNYTVEPFSLTSAYQSGSNFNYMLGAGRAYAFGFERENLLPLPISASKPRTTRDYAPAAISALFGTYVRERVTPGVAVFAPADVNDTPNTITIPGHNFENGDKVTYSNEGNTSITGPTSGNDYYIIKIDDNTLALATTAANATAKTKLTIATGSGTGDGHSLTPVGVETLGAFDPTLPTTVYLMSGFYGVGEQVGTVRVFMLDDDNGRVRLYLADNRELVTDLQSTRSICAVGTGSPSATDAYVNIEAFTPNNMTGYNQPIIQLQPHVKELTNLDYDLIVKIPNISTVGAFTLTVPEAGDTFFNDEYASMIFAVNTSTGVVADSLTCLGTNPTGGATGTITADTDHGLTGNHDFYMHVNRPSSTPRSKTLQLSSAFDRTVGGSNTTEIIFNNVAGDWTAGAGPYWDVIAIESVIEDPNGAPVDITDQCTLNVNQKDFYYGYSSITGPFDANTEYRFQIHYFSWGATGDYFTMNSYALGSSTLYGDLEELKANMPSYTNEAGTKKWNLRDVIDFRKSENELTTTARELVVPYSTLNATYSHYLPRRDKVWVDRDGRFGVSEGIAEENPKSPPDKAGTMTLFTSLLLPYLYDPDPETVYGADQVAIQRVENKNYTMLDIRHLDHRIANLEEYSSELQLEMEAYSDTVVDSAGMTRGKNGIFVDNFKNHTKGNVFEPTYRCSMDNIEGALHCPYEMNHIDFEYDTDSAVASSQQNTSEKLAPWDHVITLGVLSTPTWVSQPYATEWMNINPFAVTTWAGEILMNPASDTWVETQYAPAAQVHDPEEAARILALYLRTDAGIPNWGAWQTQIIGVDVTTSTRNGTWRSGGRSGAAVVRDTTTTTTERSTRTGTIVVQSGTDIVTQDMGERVIDVSSIPWMRPIDIEFEAFGLRPSVAVVPYFADTDVSAYVTWDGANPGGVAKTNGYVRGILSIPAKTFRTGKNVLTLKDAPSQPTSIASTEFNAQGTLYTRQQQILSVEVPVYTTRAISENRDRTTSSTETTFVRWRDPIAQTILVEDEGGIFLSGIDVYFYSKDRYLPVSLYIVETIAGVPGQKIVPYSMVTVEADDVVATKWNNSLKQVEYSGHHYNTEGTVLAHSDGDPVSGSPTDFVPTSFNFSDPIYLKEGVEYAFVLLSNSNNYNAYISRMGNFNIIPEVGEDIGVGVDKQPHLGSLLKSQNTSTWTPDQYADIKFDIRRCEFDTGASALYMRTKGQWDYFDSTATYVSGDEIIFDHGTDGLSVYQCISSTSAGESPQTTPAKWVRIDDGFFLATSLNIASDELIINGTSIARQYLFDPDVTWIDYTNKETIDLETQETIELYTDELTQNPRAGNNAYHVNLKVQMASTDSKLSPVINKNRTFAAVINNLVRTPDADAPAGATKDSGEYISETTQLKENASSLKVLIDAALPDTNAMVVPKYRILKEDVRYVNCDPALTVGVQNEPSLHTALKDQWCYVYHFDMNLGTGGSTPAAWEPQDTVIVDGVDVDNERVYLSGVSDPNNFVAKSGLGYTNPWIMITNEPDILTSEIKVYDVTDTTTGVADGNYVFNPTDYNLYQNVSGATTFSEPSATGTAWRLVPALLVDGAIAFDTDVEWREMEQVGTVNPSVDTTQFVEYEFEPKISISEEFDNFAVKVEMYSGDAVNVPVCKRLRVIAVD